MNSSDTAVGVETAQSPEAAQRQNMASGAPITQHAGGDAPAALLFQKAYQKMVQLHRIDEQLHGMIEQRQSLQSELKELQQQINGEFQRLLDESSQTPQRILQEIAQAANGDA